jgi:hypothetical protein
MRAHVVAEARRVDRESRHRDALSDGADNHRV